MRLRKVDGNLTLTFWSTSDISFNQVGRSWLYRFLNEMKFDVFCSFLKPICLNLGVTSPFINWKMYQGFIQRKHCAAVTEISGKWESWKYIRIRTNALKDCLPWIKDVARRSSVWATNPSITVLWLKCGPYKLKDVTLTKSKLKNITIIYHGLVRQKKINIHQDSVFQREWKSQFLRLIVYLALLLSSIELIWLRQHRTASVIISSAPWDSSSPKLSKLSSVKQSLDIGWFARK